jgi:hypothetical protein
MAGASGFLGQTWQQHLRAQGHEVISLVRREAADLSESHWDPYSGVVDHHVIDSADVVVNLAGAPIAHWPFSTAYQQTFTASRVRTTEVLADALTHSGTPKVFLAQNGIAGYGDQGDRTLDEDSPLDGTSVLAEVTREWEWATAAASDTGHRVVILRTSVVLDRHGGALKPLLPLFRAGLGGRVGPGTQYFSTISLADWLAAATFLATADAINGPVNLTGPNPVTNAEFTRALARAVHRPAKLPVPSWPLRKAAGPLADELLGSARVIPARLNAAGFAFAHPDIDSQLAAALN